MGEEQSPFFSLGKYWFSLQAQEVQDHGLLILFPLQYMVVCFANIGLRRYCYFLLYYLYTNIIDHGNRRNSADRFWLPRHLFLI